MNQTTQITFAILLGAIIIAGGVYFGLTQAKINLPNMNQSQEEVSLSPKVTQSASITAKVTKSLTPSLPPTTAATATPTLAEITWTKNELIQALSQKTGIAENKIKFSTGEQVKQPTKVLLRGTVSEEGAMGGAGFFAVVDQTGVQVTYVGQGVPQCTEVNPYGYPKSWADYCMNAQGKAIKR